MKQHNKYIESHESLFSKTVSMFVAYWPVFIAFGILLVSAAFIYLRYATPKYQATASLIIKDEKKGSEESKLLESLNLIGQKKIIENEIEVMHSRDIIEVVVKKMHLYAPIYRQGKVSTYSAYGTAPVFIEAKNPDQIKGVTAKIYFKYDASGSYVLLDNKLAVPVKEWVNTPYGVLRFTPNQNYVAYEVDKPYYFNMVNINAVVNGINANLKVTATNKLSSIINLQYTDKRPQLAEDVLNEIIKSYTQVSINEKNSLARNTLSFIDERLAVVRNDLDMMESKIRNYKGNAQAVEIGAQGQLYLQNVSANDKRLGELDMQLSVINELEKQVRVNNVNVGILPASLGVVDPTISQLVNSLNSSELELEKLNKTVAENNPILLAVKDQIANSKKRITENINSYRQSLETSKENLYANNRTYNKMIQTIPTKEQTLVEISRDNKIKSDIYSFLLQKREESELAYTSNLTNNQVINYAQASTTPVSPNRMIIFGSLLLGLFIVPFGALTAREKMNSSILYRNDIENLTAIPIIGELTYNDANNLMLNDNKGKPVLDEFRRLRYSLLSNGVGIDKRKIMVSSSITGEGKSYVAENLAKSYALTGKRVVLVDFDLHNSSLKEQFNMNDTLGISDYLSGDCDLEDIIQPLEGFENFSFIAAGTSKNDPFSLLERTATKDLMRFLDHNYDIIIIDTPPVIQVTDAYILSMFCDTTLFVVKHGYSPKRLIKILELNNESNLLKDTAIVFNGVKTRGFLNNSKFGYGYGYGYGNNTAYRGRYIAN